MNHFVLPKRLLPLVLAVMLTACSGAPSATEMTVQPAMPTDGSSTPSATEMAAQPANDTPITHITNHDMFGKAAVSTDGLYEVCQIRPGSCNLLYLDAATRQENYLCAAPNCTHDSESCSSYLPLEEGQCDYQLFVFQGDLYAVQCTPTSEQGPYLMRMDPDGTNRSIVLELEEGESFGGTVLGYGDRLLLKIVREDADGHSYSNLETFSPKTGERQPLFSLKMGEGESASLMGAAGTSLIFLETDGEESQYYRVDLARENPSLEQGQGNLLGPKFDGTSLYCTVQGEYFCTYDIAAGRLSGENLVTGRNKEFPLPQLAAGESAYGLALLYDDQFALAMENGEKQPVNLLLNPETGASTEVRYVSTRENGYDILAEFGDDLLYQVRIDERPLQGQEAEVSYHNVYAMVSKEDFRNGIPGTEIPFPQ